MITLELHNTLFSQLFSFFVQNKRGGAGEVGGGLWGKNVNEDEATECLFEFCTAKP